MLGMKVYCSVICKANKKLPNIAISYCHKNVGRTSSDRYQILILYWRTIHIVITYMKVNCSVSIYQQYIKMYIGGIRYLNGNNTYKFVDSRIVLCALLSTKFIVFYPDYIS